MPTPTTGSPNITSLDSKIVADLCGGNFLIDVSPSIFLTGGAAAVKGASVEIINPLGISIKDYPTSGYDIYPPMTSVYSKAVPKVAGTYLISVKLWDSANNSWVISKNVNLCPADVNNKNRNSGCLNMIIKGNCNAGKVVFLLNNPPNYKGKTFSSQVNTLTVKYPTASGKDDLDTTLGSFSLPLYEGQYQVSGSVCVTYEYGDSIYYKINYTVKCEKIIKCMIDECCVFNKLAELNMQLKSDCTQEEKDNTASIGLNAIFLLKTAELAAACGEDPSDIIDDLEKLLGCVCTCNCNEGSPIIGSQESGIDFVYRGLLTQTGTSDPTAQIDVSNNTVEIAWTRTGMGLYLGTLSGTFTPLTLNNTFLLSGSPSSALQQIGIFYESANTIRIKTANGSDVAADGILLSTAIELSIFK